MRSLAIAPAVGSRGAEHPPARGGSACNCRRQRLRSAVVSWPCAVAVMRPKQAWGATRGLPGRALVC